MHFRASPAGPVGDPGRMTPWCPYLKRLRQDRTSIAQDPEKALPYDEGKYLFHNPGSRTRLPALQPEQAGSRTLSCRAWSNYPKKYRHYKRFGIGQGILLNKYKAL
jgi:hypothetical protein